MADTSWATELHDYYHVAPYWDDDLASPRDPRTTAGSTSRNTTGY